jgi:putative ABC transport system ATP-binding protein
MTIINPLLSDIPDKITQTARPTNDNGSQSDVINLKGIEKYYVVGKDQQLVIKGIDLVIKKGETVALLGKSGSGKSTMLNILGLLDSPTAGEYYLNGKESSKYTDDDRAEIRNKTFGFIFQQFNLLPKLSVIDNVTAPLYYSADKSLWANRNKLAMDLLEKFDIADQAHKLPKLLSGGQQQRVAMARSLINDPDVIIGDEPTGALDSKTTDQVMAEIFRLNTEFGKTVIFVTHDDDLAEKFGRIVRLKDGLVVDTFEHEQV